MDNRLNITLELEEILRNYLFLTIELENWFHLINNLDKQYGLSDSLNWIKDMISKEENPDIPSPGNVVNAYKKYYKMLNDFKIWLIKYEKIAKNDIRN